MQRGPSSCQLTKDQNTAERIAKTPADRIPDARRGRPGFAVLPRRIVNDSVMPKSKTPRAAKFANKETRE